LVEQEVKNLRATIAKKQVRAPFSGRLGIRQVNLGQMLEAGNEIVVLQSLDPIYVDFKVPQQQIPLLKEGLEVRVTTEELKTEPRVGKVTTISPKVDETTRNIPVQGLLHNPDQHLRPGMYVDVTVVLPEPKDVLVIPITAILYAPFGNSVFVIEPAETGQDGAPAQAKDASAEPPPLQLRQQFVRIGEKRGDFAEVLSGLKNGERVVTTGVFKLRNGQPVKIDNSLQPDFERNPKPSNK
ncbi:MAG: efflux RND transporter periplasmic adaptor subunit, partial [Desulfuromonadales bacterium]